MSRKANIFRVPDLLKDGMSVAEISSTLKCSRQVIYCFLRQNKIKLPKIYNGRASRDRRSLYKVWHDIIRRCTDNRVGAYKNYGGRGISVFSGWINNFESFLEWAQENGYEKGLEIDRIDNNGSYAPSNCRWVTKEENSRNRRNTVLNRSTVVAARIAHTAKIKNIKELSCFFGVKETTMGDAIRGRTWADVL